ncbi:putative 3-hydroxyisobutyrate dehydrogenase [Rhodovulum sp. PH10]|uniref:NAD(P)-dependent oxidoreductase n=1 Tax=Rhodovulum sp. PH10 TaxID=1187851 RepID=UPI00027C2EEA|nr:NAD(P)-dependent oxidoreductase [Rhodovulum sp. PH10]EJW09785.1 putative 3-hydroxyisobutyrate dehydrogenase [Rhodovulum sp. PH10]
MTETGTDDATAIAFLGLGAMGSRMASNLLKAGHRVTVWNRTPAAAAPLVAAGATPAKSPREAAANAAFVLSMVRDDEASRAVWLDDDTGALDALGRDAVAIECSTVTPDWSIALAQEAAARERAFLEAPVVGSRPQAEAAALIVLAGGEADTLARARPVLDAMSSAVHHAGAIGAGALLKLSVNALLGIQVAAWAELIGFLGRAGLDVAHAVEIIGATPSASPAGKANAGLMVAKKVAPLFPVELIRKDLDYALTAAAATTAGGPSLPLVGAARDVFRRGCEETLGGENMTSVVKLYD